MVIGLFNSAILATADEVNVLMPLTTQQEHLQLVEPSSPPPPVGGESGGDEPVDDDGTGGSGPVDEGVPQDSVEVHSRLRMVDSGHGSPPIVGGEHVLV